MKFIFLLATLVLCVNALPYRRGIFKRNEIIGCSADEDTEVMFFFDTSKGVSDIDLEKEKKFVAENMVFLAEQVKISAAVYGNRVEGEVRLFLNNMAQGLAGITQKVGGKRMAAKAIKYAAENMKSGGTKIIVLLVNGEFADNTAAVEAAKSLPEGFKIYTAMNVTKVDDLKPEMEEIASEYGLLRSVGWQMAESFQLDLHVKYKFDPEC